MSDELKSSLTVRIVPIEDERGRQLYLAALRQIRAWILEALEAEEA